MRLIDADLLEKEIYKWTPKDQEAWMDSDLPPIENLVVSIMMTIQEQPTVDAIPIPWILIWLAYESVPGTSHNFYDVEAVINTMIDDWERKHEKWI